MACSETDPEKVDVLSLMRATLPNYVVNCFLAAGYDVSEVITSMDVSDNPGNSIELIERYISERYPNDPRYCNNPDSDVRSGRSFQFPPGHRIRIRNFICELRKRIKCVKVTPSVRKRRHSEGQTSSKKWRVSSTSSENDSELTVSSISNQIRSSISRWVKKQTDEKLKNLQENKQFSIVVTHVAKESCMFSSSIRCNACKGVIHLHQKDKSIKDTPYLISNWTRHVKKCSKLNSKKDSFQQSTLPRLLSQSSSRASSSALPSHEDTSDDVSQPSDSSDEHESNNPSSPPEYETQPLFVNAPPPATIIGLQEGGAVSVTNVIDWSRDARKKEN